MTGVLSGEKVLTRRNVDWNAENDRMVYQEWEEKQAGIMRQEPPGCVMCGSQGPLVEVWPDEGTICCE